VTDTGHLPEHVELSACARLLVELMPAPVLSCPVAPSMVMKPPVTTDVVDETEKVVATTDDVMSAPLAVASILTGEFAAAAAALSAAVTSSGSEMDVPGKATVCTAPGMGPEPACASSTSPALNCATRFTPWVEVDPTAGDEAEYATTVGARLEKGVDRQRYRSETAVPVSDVTVFAAIVVCVLTSDARAVPYVICSAAPGAML
jgi:hypothetical protein